MRGKSILLLAALAVTGAALFAGGPAAGKTTLVFSVPGGGPVKFLDFGEDGLKLGDRLASRGPLLDEADERVGTAHLDCMVDRRIVGPDEGVYDCEYILELDDGQIMLEGLDPHGPGSSQFAVLGSTGAYAGANGEATFTDTHERTEMVINLD
ncbi:MAG TPA: hypothetical protein VIG64_02550 [Actinomycetota bacterium]|jgi:hypothetical protein